MVKLLALDFCLCYNSINKLARGFISSLITKKNYLFIGGVHMALNNTRVLEETQATPAPEAEVLTPQLDAEVETPELPKIEENFNPEDLGKFSDKWEYVAAIVDDSVKDPSKVKDPKTGKEKEITTGKFIGYILRALEDGLEYPRTELDYNYLKNMFNFPGTVQWLKAKKGEEIQFTLPEALALFATPEINGYINGGGQEIVATYVIPESRNVKKEDENTLRIRGHLKPAKSGATLKLRETRAALKAKTSPNPKNPKIPFKTYTIQKGFERFAPVIAPRPKKDAAVAATSIAASFDKTRNEKGQAFLAAFNSRRA